MDDRASINNFVQMDLRGRGNNTKGKCIKNIGYLILGQSPSLAPYNPGLH